MTGIMVYSDYISSTVALFMFTLCVSTKSFCYDETSTNNLKTSGGLKGQVGAGDDRPTARVY